MSKGSRTTIMQLATINAVLASKGANFDYNEFRKMGVGNYPSPIYIPKRKKKKGMKNCR